MHSRQVIQGFFLIAGIAILALLILPAVHVPFIVVHGPMSALRAQRAATLFQILIQMSAFITAEFCVRSETPRLRSQNEPKLNFGNIFSSLVYVMRC